MFQVEAAVGRHTNSLATRDVRTREVQSSNYVCHQLLSASDVHLGAIPIPSTFALQVMFQKKTKVRTPSMSLRMFRQTSAQRLPRINNNEVVSEAIAARGSLLLLLITAEENHFDFKEGLCK
jgi:hypothetical protein